MCLVKGDNRNVDLSGRAARRGWQCFLAGSFGLPQRELTKFDAPRGAHNAVAIARARCAVALRVAEIFVCASCCDFQDCSTMITQSGIIATYISTMQTRHQTTM